MDEAKGVNGGAAAGGIAVTEKKTLSQGKAEGLEKCLEENKGDNTKCKDKVEAFTSSSSSSPSFFSRKPLTPIKLPSGSLSDV